MRYWVSFFALLFLVFLALSRPWACAVGPEDASEAVFDADRSLNDAFRLVSDAEVAGANVSGLTDRLNRASDALTSAEVALAAGNYSDATSLADACKAIADDVSNDVDFLKNDALSRAIDWRLTVSLSVVGAVVFVTVLFLLWRRFRRIYGERLLESKPEVVV